MRPWTNFFGLLWLVNVFFLKTIGAVPVQEDEKAETPSSAIQHETAHGLNPHGLNKKTLSEAWLKTQVQRACKKRLLPLLDLKENADLFSTEERATLKALVTNEIPFEFVNPTDLERDRYFDPRGKPALVVNGRLRDNSGARGRDVDGRTVQDKARDYRLIVQMDEILWNQYTGGGFYFPDYLMGQLLHEIIRYGWFSGKFHRHDDNYVISQRLHIPRLPQPEPKDLAFIRRFRTAPISRIPVHNQIFTGEIPCASLSFGQARSFQESIKEANVFRLREDGHLCKISIKFTGESRKPSSFNAMFLGVRRVILHQQGEVSLNAKSFDASGAPFLHNLPKTLKYMQFGNHIYLENSKGRLLELIQLRGGNVLRIGIHALFRRDPGAERVVGKAYEANLFCEDIESSLLPLAPMFFTDVAINHASNEVCGIKLQFLDRQNVRIGIRREQRWEFRRHEYRQVGPSIVIKPKERLRIKLPGEVIYFQLDPKPKSELITNTGEVLYQLGHKRPTMQASVAGKTYQGFSPCGLARHPFSEDRSLCQVTLKFESKEAPRNDVIQVGIKRVQPFESPTRWMIGTFVQAGSQLQVMLVGAGRPYTYKIRGPLLLNSFDSSFTQLTPTAQTAKLP